MCFTIEQIFAWDSPNPVLKSSPTNSSKELDELKSFALASINEDREEFGLDPILQSNNSAAQIQADEILRTGSLSHLTINGFKPYMLYSLYNGTGYIQQNVAQIHYILPTNDSQEKEKERESPNHAMT